MKNMEDVPSPYLFGTSLCYT